MGGNCLTLLDTPALSLGATDDLPHTPLEFVASRLADMQLAYGGRM